MMIAIKLATCVFFLCVAGVFAALFLRIVRKKKRCTEEVTGTVVKFSVSGDDHTTYYHPTYEYSVSGVTYKARGRISSRCFAREGSPVPVLYDPEEPKRSYIRGYDDKGFLLREVLYALAGLGFFVGALSFLFV